LYLFIRGGFKLIRGGGLVLKVAGSNPSRVRPKTGIGTHCLPAALSNARRSESKW